MDSFSYQPLDLSKKEIRLLILNPSEGSDQLSGRIIHSDILSSSEQLGRFNDNVNGYEALSYEWGTSQVDEDALERIALDGKEFLLRSNLYYALHRLRLSEKPRILWVDAMCIDQRDNRERNHQVNLMRMIYAQADRVIVWLGNKFYGPNPLRRMRDFVDHVFTARHSKEELEKLWFDGGSDDVEFKYFAVWYYLPALSYWSRLWIIQEFVLAKDLVLYLDDATADPEDLNRFCTGIDNLLVKSRWGEKQWLIDFSNTLPLRLYRQRIAIGPEKTALVPLFELVRTYGKNKCTDIRDRVFGLHSLAPQCCRDSTPVNYSASLYSICGSLVSHYLLEHHGAIEQATNDVDCSVLLEMCKSIQQALEVSASDCLTNLSLGKQSTSIKVTGNIVGVVCFDASDMPFDMFSHKFSREDWPDEKLIESLFRKGKTRALTKELVDQVWHISVVNGWHKSPPNGEPEYLEPNYDNFDQLEQMKPTVLSGVPKDEMLEAEVHVPPLVFQDQPKPLRLSERQSLPNILSNILQYKHLSWASVTLQWKEKATGYRKSEFMDRLEPVPTSDEFEESPPLTTEFLSAEVCIAALILQTPKGCRPFFCTSGMIGYAYGEVKEGDLICAFRGSPVVIALRSVSGTYEVSGVGWNPYNEIKSSKYSIEPPLAGRLRDNSLIDLPVHFLFGIQGLMLLSAHRSR